MDFRIHIPLAFLTVGISAAFAEPLLPEEITYQEASTKQVIPFRDGVLVESDHYAAESVMFAKFDEKETSTFEVEGIQHLLDVERSSEGLLFLGINEIEDQVSCSLISESAAGNRSAIELPEALRYFGGDGEDIQPSGIPRLIETNNAAALIVGDEVHWLGKGWRSRKLPEVPQFYEEFRPETFGGAHFLDGITLYAGWDHGKWGGMLAALDLGDPNAKWIHLSGKPLGDDTGIPQNNPVHSIISPKKGETWVATGLAHMGGTWRGLHHRNSGGKWRSLVDGDFEDDRGPLKLPIPSSIQGISIDQSGQIYVLAGEIGILRLTKGAMEHMIKHNFFGHSSDQKDGDFAYTVGSSPNAFGIARNGDVFVSTNSFGVLAFRRTGTSWIARQITLNKGR